MYYRILCWLKQVDLSPSLLLIPLYWLKEETQTSGFVFPRIDSSDSALNILIRKSKTANPEKFKKHIWGTFFHNYILIYLLPLRNICVEVILLLFVTILLICSKDNTAILHSLWKKKKKTHSKPAVLLSDK